MKKLKCKKLFPSVFILIIGICFGYFASYIPFHKKIKNAESSIEYYRNRYLDECLLHLRVLDISCDKSLNDYDRLYLIRSSITKGTHLMEIENAERIKKQIERNGDE